MKKYYVYIHVCPNGKRYVGATTRIKPKYRWGKNGEGYKGQPFEEAILKYGWDNIEHEVFEVDSKEEMYRKEVELISFYHSNDPRYGYNSSVGGEYSRLGCKCSEETKKKLSKANKGKTRSEEQRKRISEARKGKPHPHKCHKPFSEKARKHISEAARNRPRIKISLPDGTVLEMTKQNLTRNYINKGRKFEYVS